MAERKNPAPNLDYWTGFFHGANGSIFDVIENAISVAGATCPQELRSRRDRIIEKLYTFETPRCFGCLERCNNQQLEEAGSVKHDRRTGEKEKLEGPEDIERMVISKGSNSSYDEVEALTDEMERESEVVGEVNRIKEILVHNEDQSENSLFDSLRRLQLMDLSVDTLQATEIGKAVNGIRKHNSKKIRQLARILIEGWKSLVDQWASATITEKLNDNTNVSNNENYEEDVNIEDEEEEEEGLPSPPLDEGAFLATSANIQLSEFFDGMDDDGNLRNDKQPQLRNNSVNKRQQEEQPPAIKQNRPPVSNNSQMRPPPQVNPLTKSKKPVNSDLGPSKPTRTQNPVQRKPPAGANNDRLNGFEDDKLETAKRRLQEGYQQAENAKKQRTIQVLDDIPKPKMVQNRNNNLKAKNNIRSWAARH